MSLSQRDLRIRRSVVEVAELAGCGLRSDNQPWMPHNSR